MNQIDIHNKVDKLLSQKSDQAKKEDVFGLISINEDAHSYFYSKADANWLLWLWENGFLDVIRQKSKDPSRYSYQMPELNYISKVVIEKPKEVTDIIISTPISGSNFNPEVIDHFLRICGSLPAEQLARIVPKIHEDKWVQLMGKFNHLDFTYEKIFEVLVEAGDFSNVLLLAESIFSIKPKKEKEVEEQYGFMSDSPFYFNNLSDTKIFESLLKVDTENLEKALAITTNLIHQIVMLAAKDGKEEVFTIYDSFTLYHVNFFDLKLSEKHSFSHRDDVKNLAAVIKYYAQGIIGKQCGNKEFTERIYKKYFEPLPDSRSMWRLRLFVLSLCPEDFKERLKDSFFRLFDTDHYYEIISGTEYENTLKIGFPVLSDADKRRFVKNTLKYFIQKDKDKESEKENWHLRYGSQILSMIVDELTEEEKQMAKQMGFSINPSYKPGSDGDNMRGGAISPQAPITKEEFGKLSIQEISEKLRREWSPQVLKEQYKNNDDFLNPHNAEGVGDQLKNNIPERIQDYVNNAQLFFDRKTLDSHYTYSFLRGMQDILRNNTIDKDKIFWDNLLNLCVVIKDSGAVEQFEREKRDSFDGWLAGWDAVHLALTDVIQEILNERGENAYVNFVKYRPQIFEIIKYLLGHPDPEISEEEIETAKSKTKSPGNSEYSITDPYSMAINRVRGRAFQALIIFLFLDSRQFPKESEVKISSDVKELYETVLEQENTRAIMFMFGRYLSSFYFRDKKWMHGIIPYIFSENDSKKYLYIAAWEGYLSENLYLNMFDDPVIQNLYERGILLTDSEFPNQKHFKEPDEGLANHLALAYMYHSNFGFGHPLFEKFWRSGNIDQQTDFVSILGRLFVAGSNGGADNLLKENPETKQRIRNLWDYLLNNFNEPKLFTEMGSWISLKKDIFEANWLAQHVKAILQKTDGGLDWDYGLTESIIELAKAAPEDALIIGRLYFLEGGIRKGNLRRPFNVDKEWYDAFRILYENSKTKDGLQTLVGELIKEGSAPFWHLKDILIK